MGKDGLMHWLLHFLGVDSTTDNAYAWWSGPGSDIGELAMLGWLYAFLRKHNCHVHRCWRIGRHPVGGTTWITCRRHHPDGHITAQQILRKQ